MTFREQRRRTAMLNDEIGVSRMAPRRAPAASGGNLTNANYMSSLVWARGWLGPGYGRWWGYQMPERSDCGRSTGWSSRKLFVSRNN